MINPNVSIKASEHIERVLNEVKFQDTYLEVVNPERGPPSIESYYDVSMSVPEVINLVKRRSGEFDSFLLACFADPGLETLKELLDKPVVGIMEASIHIACMLGERFSIIAINKRRAGTKWRYVRSLGLSDRMVSVIPIEMSVEEMEENAEKLIGSAVRAVNRAKEEGAEVAILGCASMAGYAKEIERRTGVCIVDPIVVGFKIAEILADIGLSQSKVGSYSTPKGVI